MIKISFFFAVSIFALPAIAQQECLSIKNDKNRLACFDKAVKQQAASTTPSAGKVESEPKPEPKPAAPKFWTVNEKADAMTDRKSCTALYKGAWTHQGAADTFFISLRGRGGVKAYTVRIDDAPPHSMQLATDMEKKISAADLRPYFPQILEARRLRVEIVTILDTVLVEDIDLTGFKDAIEKVRSCN